MTGQNAPRFERRRALRYIGIMQASQMLGVTNHHLRKVLNGERQSARLLVEVQKRFPGLLG